MSSGAFTDSFYLSNKLTTTHPIRVQPETIALVLGGQANTAPSGTGAIGPSAQVSKSSRSIGINARTVSIRLTATLAGYKAGSVIRLPWLDPDTFDAITPKVTTGTYLSTACIVVGIRSEEVN
jgi:hypothetical protein